MVICLFVGCMCSPCVRSRSLVKTFREPMGNSLVLLQAIRDLFPVWDVSAEQALRAWILSMPSSIRARLEALSLDELQQLSGASPPPAYTQTVRLFMPRSPARSLLTSFDTTEPQHNVFTSTEATSSTASILSVFGNAQASLSAPPRLLSLLLLLLSTHSSLIIGGSPLLLSDGGSPPASPASHLAGLLRRRDPSTNPGPIAWWVSVGN